MNNYVLSQMSSIFISYPISIKNVGIVFLRDAFRKLILNHISVKFAVLDFRKALHLAIRICINGVFDT
jgi:hypothetical protein